MQDTARYRILVGAFETILRTHKQREMSLKNMWQLPTNSMGKVETEIVKLDNVHQLVVFADKQTRTLLQFLKD
jgi:hypothetical protein